MTSLRAHVSTAVCVCVCGTEESGWWKKHPRAQSTMEFSYNREWMLNFDVSMRLSRDFSDEVAPAVDPAGNLWTSSGEEFV